MLDADFIDDYDDDNDDGDIWDPLRFQIPRPPPIPNMHIFPGEWIN